MSHDHSPEAVKKEVRIYIGVFVALMVCTILTVAASYMDVGVALGIGIALAIATVKGGLVACFFMHLRSEKALIFFCLAMMFLCFLGLLFVPVGMQADTLTDNVP